LTSKEFLNLEVKDIEIEDVEKEIVKEFDIEYSEEFVNNLMVLLDKEKDEGEKNIDFERRLLKDLEKYVG
jgi:uncharacterized protein YpuA (DUF1002 family)